MTKYLIVQIESLVKLFGLAFYGSPNVSQLACPPISVSSECSGQNLAVKEKLSNDNQSVRA